MKRKKMATALIAALTITATSTAFASASIYHRVAGPQGTTKGITSYDWSLTPAGRQTTLGDFPMGGALSPDGKYLAVSNDGQGAIALQLVDTSSGKVVQTISYASPEALYLGVAFSPDGKHLYASAGGNNKIRVFDCSNGRLTEQEAVSLKDNKNTNFYPAGLTVSKDGRFLYAANNLNQSVSKIDIQQKKIVATANVGKNPYAAYLTKGGDALYVSNWGESSVSVLDPNTLQPKKTVRVGLHPNAIAENQTGGRSLRLKRGQ
ncbi:YncE family protein [Terrilactibacillus sp. S3-3]|nr:YncE family protein [Terrilactibacillus sp. S3-3]